MTLALPSPDTPEVGSEEGGGMPAFMALTGDFGAYW